MSEFRKKLDTLFIKWLDNKEAPTLTQVQVMVEYAKIPPEPHPPEMLNPLTLMMLTGMLAQPDKLDSTPEAKLKDMYDYLKTLSVSKE